MAPAPQWLTNDFFKDIIKRAIDHEISISDDEIILTVRVTQALVSFAPLAFKLFYAARQNAVLRRSPFPPP